jgi:hypothetical protein
MIKIENNEIEIKEEEEKLENESFIENDNDSDSTNKKKPRGSRYRGVSRNGNQWQVNFYFKFQI